MSSSHTETATLRKFVTTKINFYIPDNEKFNDADEDDEEEI